MQTIHHQILEINLRIQQNSVCLTTPVLGCRVSWRGDSVELSSSDISTFSDGCDGDEQWRNGVWPCEADPQGHRLHSFTEMEERSQRFFGESTTRITVTRIWSFHINIMWSSLLFPTVNDLRCSAFRKKTSQAHIHVITLLQVFKKEYKANACFLTLLSSAVYTAPSMPYVARC